MALTHEGQRQGSEPRFRVRGDSTVTVPMSETAAGIPITMQNVTMADFSLSKYLTVHCRSVQVYAANTSSLLSVSPRQGTQLCTWPARTVTPRARASSCWAAPGLTSKTMWVKVPASHGHSYITLEKNAPKAVSVNIYKLKCQRVWGLTSKLGFCCFLRGYLGKMLLSPCMPHVYLSISYCVSVRTRKPVN